MLVNSVRMNIIRTIHIRISMYCVIVTLCYYYLREVIIIFSCSVLLILTSDLVAIVVIPTGNANKSTDHLRIQNLDIYEFGAFNSHDSFVICVYPCSVTGFIFDRVDRTGHHW